MNDAVIKTDNKEIISLLSTPQQVSARCSIELRRKRRTKVSEQSLVSVILGQSEIQYWPNPRLYGAALFGYNMDKTGPVWPPASKLIYSSPGQHSTGYC